MAVLTPTPTPTSRRWRSGVLGDGAAGSSAVQVVHTEKSVTPDGEARGEEKSVKPVDEAREEEEKSVEEAVHDDYFQYFHGLQFPPP